MVILVASNNPKKLGELERMAPQWPAADFDVEEQRGRLQSEPA